MCFKASLSHPILSAKYVASVLDLIVKILNDTCHMQLTYMSNVIKENLRIQPPISYIPTRGAIEDIEFEGKVIPKGVSLILLSF